MGCALFVGSMLSSGGMPFSWTVANEAPNLSLELVEKEVAEFSAAPVTAKAIDVVALAVPPQKNAASQAQVADIKTNTNVASPSPAPVVLAETKPVTLIGASGEAIPVAAPMAAPQTAAAPAPAAPAALASLAPAAQQDVYPLILDLKVSDGDTLMNILTDTGVSYNEAHQAVESLRKLYNPKNLDIGQSVSVTLAKSGNEPVISSLSVPMSNVASVQVTRKGDGVFAAKEIKAQLFQESARAGGEITSSLYETGINSGIPANILGELISAYSYDVDFQRDIHSGDRIDVLFERLQTKEGTVAENGNVLFAELTLSGKPIRIYRFADKAGNVDFYNEKGESIRKALLRTPINGAKITSGFGMRSHPILGYSKMHRGVDFGAPTGTPIYAAGDGIVSFSGKKGGYGNYLSIKHDKKYASAYAHISRFASGIAPGKKVKQGQIVAYVGSTGHSTGPHLHYEILVNNTQVNPAGIKFKTGNVLGGKELAAFKKNVAYIQAQLASKKINVAMNTR
ncbi:MAG: peptidoglycan DD-metalloendopeptidase family protein [Rickettsiales bacterium]|nr:peptidoglycan DD-metalloendopeptidase family protein [Rickettsiales bacterium]